MSIFLAMAGTWLIADGIFSLLVHTKPPLSQHQDWLHDHSLRVIRCLVGIALIVIGWGLR